MHLRLLLRHRFPGHLCFADRIVQFSDGITLCSCRLSVFLLRLPVFQGSSVCVFCQCGQFSQNCVCCCIDFRLSCFFVCQNCFCLLLLLLSEHLQIHNCPDLPGIASAASIAAVSRCSVCTPYSREQSASMITVYCRIDFRLTCVCFCYYVFAAATASSSAFQLSAVYSGRIKFFYGVDQFHRRPLSAIVLCTASFEWEVISFRISAYFSFSDCAVKPCSLQTL